mgnify:CR=1 FL=1
MQGLDEIDLEILAALAADARRPYSDIGDQVGLSGPAVSDRVTRLKAAGVINRFTIDVDRSQLRAGIPVFVRVDTADTDLETLRETVAAAEPVEHVFVSADGTLLFYARAAGVDVRPWLEDLLGDAEYSVTLIDDYEWTPSIDGTEFALTCAECGNTVDSEGETTRIDGAVYHFCCPSCASRFQERYTRHAEQA